MSLRFGDFFRGGLVLAALLGLALLLTHAPEAERTGLASAIDGDSLRVDGVEMRLEGIDAPELSQTCRRGGETWDCGRHARLALARILARGLVTCIGSAHDVYGRLLVRCRMRGADVNAEMVREGFAVAFGGYREEEEEAHRASRGLWDGTFQRPQDWRREHPRPHGSRPAGS